MRIVVTHANNKTKLVATAQIIRHRTRSGESTENAVTENEGPNRPNTDCVADMTEQEAPLPRRAQRVRRA